MSKMTDRLPPPKTMPDLDGMTDRPERCPLCSGEVTGVGFMGGCVDGGSHPDVRFWPAVAALQAENARLNKRLDEIDAGAQADEDDLNKMRDGTKLTRSGVVRIIVYQQQDIRELKQRVAELEGKAPERQTIFTNPIDHE